MPYQYLTFSDLYEEEVRSSAPSSPFIGASASPSLSPVFLLPTASPSHASTSYRHHHMPMSSHDSQRSHAHPSRSHSHSHRRRTDVHDHAMLKTFTQDSDDVAPPTSSPSSSSSSSLHLDFLRVFKRKASLKSKKSHQASDSAFSTPASSRRSSFTSHGFASLHPVSAASSANTSPAISRQVTKMSDYEAMVQKTIRAEELDEQNRQRQLQAYFNEAAETGLSLRRF